MIGPQGKPEDAVGAYNTLKGGNMVLAQMQRVMQPSGGGGGGNMGRMTMNGGSMSSGPADFGQVQTSVSGGIVGGGVGGSHNNAEVDLLFGGPSNPGSFNPNNITPPNVQMPTQSVPTTANFRVQPNNQGGGFNQNMTMRVPGQNVGSTNDQVQIGSVSMGGSSGGGGSRPDNVIGVDVESGGGSYSSGSAPSMSGSIQQALSGALQQHGGSDNMVQRTIADLRSTGMQWNQIYDPSKADSDPGKYQLLQDGYGMPGPRYSSADGGCCRQSNGGSANVTPQHVEVVQNMLDADPRWSPQNISYSDVYTAQALTEAHQSDASLYGSPYLSKDYVDSVRNDPGFTPRPVPMRNAIGQIVDYAKSKVPRTFADEKNSARLRRRSATTTRR